MRLSILGLPLLVASLRADVLTVGAGKTFPTIEAANAAARPNDVIEVYPADGDGVYRSPAVYVTTSGLRFIAKPADAGRIVLDGDVFDYSGRGSTPRAIFQVNLGADDVVIDGFELRGASNTSHNAAGVRINQANRVTVRRCDIHDNQMGVMSNGAADGSTAIDQLIESCTIHHNGDANDPGYNHNLYLGGGSATMQFCDVHDSLTGHNIKSRARFNLFQYNHVHDSANREFDLVDDAVTALPNAHAVLLGNFIEKRDPIDGNTNVIHFGQDGGGEHDGALFLLNNTVVTPHNGSIIFLSASKVRAQLVNNVIYNPRQSSPRLYDLVRIDDPRVITGDHNWLSAGYDASRTGMDPQTTYHGQNRADHPALVDPASRDFRMRFKHAPQWPCRTEPQFLDGQGVAQPAVPQFQYASPTDPLPRGGARALYLGAGVDLWPQRAPLQPR